MDVQCRTVIRMLDVDGGDGCGDVIHDEDVDVGEGGICVTRRCSGKTGRLYRGAPTLSQSEGDG